MNSFRKDKSVQFSSAVKEQLEKGNKIEAIKILREETGINLKEAKELIDNAINKRIHPGDNIKNNDNIYIPENVLDYLREGKKIDAIKALRHETGLGMKDFKDTVEKVLLENPEIKLKYDDETKRGVINFLLFTLAIILIVLLVYYFSGK
jgi:ribosomal protein L7/L12